MAENRVKTLRRGLEGWREVLVGAHSVLTWEKQFYPGVVASVITILFLLIWYIDPAVLTFLSLLGILITMSDFLVLQVVPLIYGANHWTGADERKYDQVVTSLAGCWDSMCWFVTALQSLKLNKPKTFFFVVTGSLIIFAWIGSTFNNMFLTYLIVLLAGLFPGLRRQKPVKKFLSSFMERVSEFSKKQSSSDSSKSVKSE